MAEEQKLHILIKSDLLISSLWIMLLESYFFSYISIYKLYRRGGDPCDIYIFPYNALWSNSPPLLICYLPPFKNNFSRFHYSIFMHAYEVLWSHLHTSFTLSFHIRPPAGSHSQTVTSLPHLCFYTPITSF
jgi:hypothetical protein